MPVCKRGGEAAAASRPALVEKMSFKARFNPNLNPR